MLTLRGAAVALTGAALWAAGIMTGLALPMMIGVSLVLAAVLSILLTLIAAHVLRVDTPGEQVVVTRGEPIRLPLTVRPGWLRRLLPLRLGELPRASQHRGIQQVAVPRAATTDPFGLARAQCRTGGAAQVLVVPRLLTEGLPDPRSEHGAPPLSQGEPTPFSRPYVQGDDLRLIHWKASARTGELMTRVIEAEEQRRALVVLDDPDGTLTARTEAGERAADACASAVRDLLHTGWRVQLRQVLSSGEVTTAPATAADALADLALARDHDPGTRFPGAVRAVRAESTWVFSAEHAAESVR